jgi:sugar fermentation stimulation protein A
MRAMTDPLARAGIAIEARLDARLVRRYKRFLADVRLPDGREITVHCPNPGRMLGTQDPGAAVRCSTHDDPRRKLRHTLEMIRVGRVWVGLHAARANDVAQAALAAGVLAPFSAYQTIEREVACPDGSRFDFRLSDPAPRPPDDAPRAMRARSKDPAHGMDGSTAVGTRDERRGRVCWLEVKSVTLCAERRARFPDAVTLRGRRHLEHLEARVRAGERAALVFVAQRADADSVAPADDIDPAYGAALRRAAAAGVEIHALSARVTPSSIRLARVLPVLL